jgi:hypothetical protein
VCWASSARRGQGGPEECVRSKNGAPLDTAPVGRVKVLILLLLPATGDSGDRDMTAPAEARLELVDRFKGVTAYVRSPPRASAPRQMATPKQTLAEQHRKMAEPGSAKS